MPRRKIASHFCNSKHFLGRKAFAFTGTCCLRITSCIIPYPAGFVNSFFQKNPKNIKKIGESKKEAGKPRLRPSRANSEFLVVFQYPTGTRDESVAEPCRLDDAEIGIHG